MKKLYIISCLVILLTISGCSYGEITIEDAPTNVTQTCHRCHSAYGNSGYIFTIGTNNLSICKECRDDMMRNDSWFEFNDRIIYPFENQNIYRDPLAAFVIPDNYFQVDVDTEFLEDFDAEFLHQDYADIVIFFSKEDFFEDIGFTPTLEERKSMTLDSEMKEENEGFVDYFMPESCSGYKIEYIQEQAFFIYYSDQLDVIKVLTIKNGVTYTFVYVNFSEYEISYADNSTEILLSDLYPMFKSLAYPPIDEVIKYYDN